MHANAPKPRRQIWHERLLRSRYLLVALVIHLIAFFMVATLVIWRAPEPPLTAEFHGVKITPPPPPPPSPPPPSGAEALNRQLEPDLVVVPVVTPMSAITTSSSNFKIDVAKALNQSFNHISQQAPRGSGLTAGGDTGSSGTGSGYGVAGNGNGLVGALYDLKQTPYRQPTDMAENPAEIAAGPSGMDGNYRNSTASAKNLEVLRDFVGNWDMNLLDKYYKSPQPLVATQLCIPATPSVNAPKAFRVENVVSPRRWIIIYQAKVKPPSSGRFRFIGFADDFLVVRVNGQNVLDACMPEETLDPSANANEPVGVGLEHIDLKCGKWIQLDSRNSVPIQILIGEGPGGTSGFLLMVQKEGDGSSNSDYPIFQVRDTPIPDLSTGNDSSYFHISNKKMLFPLAPQ
jgi:hypothetical protein